MNLLSILFIVFLAELPCMARTAALYLSGGNIWDVAFGTVLGNAAALALGVFFAKFSPEIFGDRYLAVAQSAAGVMFVLLGIYLLFFESH